MPDRARARRAPGARAVPRQRRAALRGRAARRRPTRRRRARAARAGRELVGATPSQTTVGRRRARRAQGRRSSTPARSTRLAVVASAPTAARRSRSSPPARPASPSSRSRAFDPTAPMYAVELADVAVARGAARRRGELGRLTTIGALLAAAEAVGAAGRMLDDACALRRRAPPVRPHDRQLPGAAPPAGRHVRAPGERVVDGPLRGRRARRRRSTRPQRTASIAKAYVVARGARGRARRDAGLRRHRLHRRSTRRTASCAGSSSASSSSATPPTTSARSGGRSRPPPSRELGAADGADDRDRLQRPDRPAPGARSRTGAEPEVVGPLLADVAARPALAALRRRADLGRQVEPHLPRRLATPARSSCAARRSGTSCPPRTTWSASTACCTRSRAPPCRCRASLHLGDADGAARRAVLRDGARASATSAATRCPPGYADAPERARGDRRGARRRARRPAHRRPGRGRPGGVRPARPASWSASCAAGRKQWEASKVARAAGARRAARRARAHAAASSAPPRSCTATTGSTTRSCTRRAPGRIVAVLDWEMSTLGDPFTDLGALLAFWSEDGRRRRARRGARSSRR